MSSLFLYTISESRTILPPLDYYYLFTGLLTSERNSVCSRYAASPVSRGLDADGALGLRYKLSLVKMVLASANRAGRLEWDKPLENERLRCVEPAFVSSSGEN